MKKILCLSLCLSSIIVAQSPKAYFDMSPMWMSYESNGISNEFNPTGFKWTGGYKISLLSLLPLKGLLCWGSTVTKKVR